MAELADAADLKSAGLKKLVGVRVPLSAPSVHTFRAQRGIATVFHAFRVVEILRLASLAQDFGSRLPLRSRPLAPQLKIRRAQKARGICGAAFDGLLNHKQCFR